MSGKESLGMIKTHKKLSLVIGLMFMSMLVAACSPIDFFTSNFNETFRGIPMHVQTFDAKSRLIDDIKMKSMSIDRDRTFDDYSGDSTNKSKVLEITGGGHRILHSGSSLIASQDRLTNVLSKNNAKAVISNSESSVPLLSSIKNSYRDYFIGHSKVILIRSQQGYPLATYVGNNVSYRKTSVPASTILMIDGKRLFIYRCDFTVYDNELIK